MSDTATGLHHKLESAAELRSVVRTMKAVAASNISQYQACLAALDKYSKSVELGLSACLHKNHFLDFKLPNFDLHGQFSKRKSVAIIVLGSDLGLVGQFNDDAVGLAAKAVKKMKTNFKIWAVGQRVQERLTLGGLRPIKYYPTPTSVNGISPLVGNIIDGFNLEGVPTEICLFYNQSSRETAYATVTVKLLPLDQDWLKKISAIQWPSNVSPDIIGASPLQSILREYLFIGIYQACAQSLACENAYRLASMQRADTNITSLVESLTGAFNRLRQSKIDEELFDVISGFESLKHTELKTQ